MSNPLVLELKNIFIQNQLSEYEIGIIDPVTKYLTNITHYPSLTIFVEVGKVIIDRINGTIIPLTAGSIVLRLGYKSLSNTVSLWAIQPIIFPKQSDMLQLIYKYLPPNSYTDSTTSTVYSKNLASAYILSQLYFNDNNISVQSLLNNIFPPFSSSFSWEQQLNNNAPWEESFDYALVVQIVNNLSLSTDCNYDVTLLISQYIWARFGRAVYVHIRESNSIFIQEWILDSSQLGINTVLSGDGESQKQSTIYIQDLNILFYSAQIQAELLFFAQKLVPADVSLNLLIIIDFADIGLIIDIQDTYRLDPRLFTLFALQYSTDAVYNSLALISPYNPIFITSFIILPPFATVAPLSSPIVMTSILTYTYAGITYSQDVTSLTEFSSSHIDVFTILGNKAIPGATLGSSVITGNYLNPIGQQFNIFATVIYNVNSGFWVLDTSTLGDTTTLN